MTRVQLYRALDELVAAYALLPEQKDCDLGGRTLSEFVGWVVAWKDEAPDRDDAAERLKKTVERLERHFSEGE